MAQVLSPREAEILYQETQRGNYQPNLKYKSNADSRRRKSEWRREEMGGRGSMRVDEWREEEKKI